MYVILTKDVANLGQKNSVHSVSDGYFLNYLFPNKLAQSASANMIRRVKDKQKALQANSSQQKQVYTEAIDLLSGSAVKISGKANQKGTLFKAISPADIAKAIKKETGLDIEQKSIHMDHFKSIGDHTAVLKLGTREIEVRVEVVAG